MFYETVSKSELTQFWPIFKRVPKYLLSNLTSFKLIDLEGSNAILVNKDNRVYFFGTDYKEFCSGLNQRYQGRSQSNQPVEILEDIFVKDVVLNEQHILVLDTSGDLYSWGHEASEEFPAAKRHFKWKCLSKNRHFISVEYACSYVVALTQHGTVFCWKEYNQHFNPDPKSELSRVKVKQISCGNDHSLALASSGHLYSWGNNDCGQLAIGHKRYGKNPVRNTFNELFKQISAGANHSLMLSRSGQVYGAGDNEFDQVCGSNSNIVYYPQLVSHTKNYHIKAIGAQSNTSVALTSNGKCLVWGKMQNNYRRLKYMVVDLNSIGKALARYCPDKDTRHMVRVGGSQAHSYDNFNFDSSKSAFDEMIPFDNEYDDTETEDSDDSEAEESILPFPLEQSAISSSVVCVNPFLSRLHRLFDSGPESDICFSVLQCNRRPIFANCGFLQNSCDYFGTMLSDRWLTNSKRDSDGKFIVEIGASSYSVYYSYLAFLYTGELVVRDEDQQCEDQVLFELFDLALCNGQCELSQLCIDRLFHSISIANWCQLYQISSLYGPQLESEQRTLMDVPIGHFITNNLDSVLRSSEFALMESQLCKQLVIQFGSAAHSTQSGPKQNTNLAQVNQVVPSSVQFGSVAHSTQSGPFYGICPKSPK